MVTFTILCLLLMVLICFVIGILLIPGTIIGGCLIVVADVVLGLLPFVLLYKLIKWLLAKRG